MENLAIFYGGKSVEHDISVITFLQVVKNINLNKYKVYPVYITKDNKFVAIKNFDKVSSYVEKSKVKKVKFEFGSNTIVYNNKKVQIDTAINCCHGGEGEGGVLFGICKMCNIPLSSLKSNESALCQDKSFMKDVFVANDIPCVKYKSVFENMDFDNGKLFKEIETQIKFPCIIKPCCLGSSVGIYKCKNKDELNVCLKSAFEFENKVIVEQFLSNMKEINVACVKKGDKLIFSNVEQPKNFEEFLNFDNKYLSSNEDDKIMNPKLKKQTIQKLHNLIQKMDSVFDFSGVVRIDFMLDENENVFVNEINAVPGSLACYLFDDLEFFQLLDLLIEDSKNKHKLQTQKCFNFKSDVLLNYQNNMNKYAK